MGEPDHVFRGRPTVSVLQKRAKTAGFRGWL